MFKKAFFLLLAVAFPLLGEEVEGEYTVKGFDPYLNEPYQGKAYFKKLGENIYEGYWEVGDPLETYSGTGILEGNQLHFVFKIKNDHGKKIGIQNYIIENGKMGGDWIFFGGNKRGRETLEKKNAKRQVWQREKYQ